MEGHVYQVDQRGEMPAISSSYLYASIQTAACDYSKGRRGSLISLQGDVMLYFLKCPVFPETLTEAARHIEAAGKPRG